jgi:hypothetical protein
MRSDQHGIILVLVLLCMTLLAAAGIGLAMSSSVSRMSAANHEESVMLLNAAESALALAARELGRYRLDEILSGAQQSTLVDGIAGLRTIAPGTTIDLNALTNHLTCGRPTPCTDLQRRQVTRERPWGGNNPRWRLFIQQPLNVPASLPVSTPPVYVVVWLGDDAREEDDDPDTDGAGPAQEGRYILRARAEAFGPRAGRRAIEAELVRMCTTQAESESCLPGSRVQSWRAVSAQIP